MLTIETSGDSALIRWRQARTTATMTRRRVALFDVIATPPKSGLIVLFGDPATDPDCDITTVTLNVAASTSTLAVASTALVMEEMLAHSVVDPVMCAVIIVGHHNATVHKYVRGVAKRRGTHVYTLRARHDSYSYADTDHILASVTKDLEQEMNLALNITWDIELGALDA